MKRIAMLALLALVLAGCRTGTMETWRYNPKNGRSTLEERWWCIRVYKLQEAEK